MSGTGLDATSRLYGLDRKTYFWGLFVETDRRLRKRILELLRCVPSVMVGRPIGLDIDALAETFKMRRRWFERRRTFRERVIDRMHRGRHAGVGIGYTAKEP